MRPNPTISTLSAKVWIGFGSSLVFFFVLTWANLAVHVKTAHNVMTATPALAGVLAEPISDTSQATEYESDAPKTILQLQQFRQTTSIAIRSGGGKAGVASLANLNPTVNMWYVLTIAWSGTAEATYHLENPAPTSQRLALDGSFPAGIVILEGANRYPCDLFGTGSAEAPRSGPKLSEHLRSFVRGAVFI